MPPPRRQRRLQRAYRGIIELAVSPLQQPDRFEGVALQSLHQFGLERVAAAGGAEGTVADGTSRPPGNLAEFSGIELAELVAVELAVGGKSDVVDVEVEPHADRVGRDQIIDVAVLVERDLRVSRARR